MKAYVLIQTGAGGEPIARRVEAIPGVISAEDLAGAYDAIAVAPIRPVSSSTRSSGTSETCPA